MNVLAKSDRATVVWKAWEVRASAAIDLCGTNGITTADVDGIQYAATVLLRIRGGSDIATERADLVDMKKRAYELSDEPAKAAVRWTLRALKDLEKQEATPCPSTT